MQPSSKRAIICGALPGIAIRAFAYIIYKYAAARIVRAAKRRGVTGDMSIRICWSCGKQIQDDAKFCPYCGEAQEEDIRLTKIPKSIEELREFCEQRGMPLEKMRFFIGEDYREPRAFGIYRESNGDVVVYKNKVDGSRSIRYSGPDEAYGAYSGGQRPLLRSETAVRRSQRHTAFCKTLCRERLFT